MTGIPRPLWLAAAALSALGAAWLGLAYGSVSLPPGAVLQWGDGQAMHRMVLDLRAPRVALAAGVGAALALSGAALQGLLRNPLADPYVLGVSSGAALGAALALVGALALPTPVAAFGGALGALALVYGVGRGGSGEGLILAGVAVGLTLAAGLALVLFHAQARAGDVVLWLMGRLGEATWPAVFWVSGTLAVGGALLVPCARALDLLAQGEGSAAAMGVPVVALTWAVVGASSLLVAGGVAFAGLIGFVGLVVPHAVRYAVGPAHRWLFPVSTLFGATTLVLADLGARTALDTGELPVGVVTGALGGPFFLVLLRRRLHVRA